MKKKVRIVKDLNSCYDSFRVQFLVVSYSFFGLKKIEKWKDIVHTFGSVGTRFFSKLEDAEKFAENWDGTEIYPSEIVVKEYV